MLTLVSSFTNRAANNSAGPGVLPSHTDRCQHLARPSDTTVWSQPPSTTRSCSYNQYLLHWKFKTEYSKVWSVSHLGVLSCILAVHWCYLLIGWFSVTGAGIWPVWAARSSVRCRWDGRFEAPCRAVSILWTTTTEQHSSQTRVCTPS